MSIYTLIPGAPDSDYDVKPGMASYFNSGPFGKTCGDCIHRGYFRAGKSKFNAATGLIEETQRRTLGCREFLRLSGRHGPKVHKDWAACKYFEPKPQPAPKPTKASDYECVKVSGVDLRDTIASIRARRRFKGFLDSLLARTDQPDVFISYRRWNWLRDLAQRAGLIGAANTQEASQ